MNQTNHIVDIIDYDRDHQNYGLVGLSQASVRNQKNKKIVNYSKNQTKRGRNTSREDSAADSKGSRGSKDSRQKTNPQYTRYLDDKSTRKSLELPEFEILNYPSQQTFKTAQPKSKSKSRSKSKSKSSLSRHSLSNDSQEEFDDHYQHLKNDVSMLMKEIESQEDPENIDYICGIEKEVIEMEARNYETLSSLRIYFEKVCDFYCQRVTILMKEIHSRLQDVPQSEHNLELDRLKHRIEELEEQMTAVEDENHQLKDKEEVLNTHVNSLRNEISNFELVQNRLKALEIENMQFRKRKLTLADHENKIQQLEDEMAIVNGLLNLDDTIIQKMEFDDLGNWEKKMQNTLRKLSEQKDHVFRDFFENSEMRGMCVVCNKKRVEVVLNPCRHVCLCDDCSKNLTKCPFDRGEITGKEKIYLSQLQLFLRSWML